MGTAEYVLVTLLVLVLLAGILAVRRLRSIRSDGVDVSLRHRLDDTGRGWRLGVGHYCGDEFLWYRVISISSRPAQVIPRAGLTIADRREPRSPETYAIPQGATVLRCQSDNGTLAELELAMGDQAMTGFLSWLESAPPGHSVSRTS